MGKINASGRGVILNEQCGFVFIISKLVVFQQLIVDAAFYNSFNFCKVGNDYFYFARLYQNGILTLSSITKECKPQPLMVSLHSKLPSKISFIPDKSPFIGDQI
jgi:hypothetical protein